MAPKLIRGRMLSVWYVMVDHSLLYIEVDHWYFFSDEARFCNFVDDLIRFNLRVFSDERTVVVVEKLDF